MMNRLYTKDHSSNGNGQLGGATGTRSRVPRSWWRALLGQRCPRCRQGKLFAASTRMHPACPVCGLVMAREEGYFMGAMYFSYALAIVFMSVGMLLWHLLLPRLDLSWIVLLTTVSFVPFVPMVFRYSRVIWIYFDRWAWPENPTKGS
jgi:uncharacterized protein (DUF983 family)